MSTMMKYEVSEPPHAKIEALHMASAANKPCDVAEVRDYHLVATWNNDCLDWDVRDPISR
jgi:hypothetical protein